MDAIKRSDRRTRNNADVFEAVVSKLIEKESKREKKHRHWSLFTDVNASLPPAVYSEPFPTPQVSPLCFLCKHEAKYFDSR